MLRCLMELEMKSRELTPPIQRPRMSRNSGVSIVRKTECQNKYVTKLSKVLGTMALAREKLLSLMSLSRSCTSESLGFWN